MILEAFAAGVPVIAFPSGGIPEVVENGVTGLLAKDREEMAQSAIELLTGDPWACFPWPKPRAKAGNGDSPWSATTARSCKLWKPPQRKRSGPRMNTDKHG